MFDNDEMPKSHGIDKSGGAGNSPEALTASGISNVPTDNVLRTASELSSGSVTEGATLENLGTTASALKEGSEKFAFPTEGGADDPRSYPVSNFMRPEAARKGERTGGF